MGRPLHGAIPLATPLLLAWLPAVKAALPGGRLRFVLFYGGGTLLAAWAIRREPGPLPLRPLFARPVRGLAEGALAFALLLAAAGLLLTWPARGSWLPTPLHDPIALFDPRTSWLAWQRDGVPPPSGGAGAAWVTLGAVAEEWIFHVALFWRWLAPPSAPAVDQSDVSGADGTATAFLPGWGWGVAARLLAVSLYFAALHLPQPPGQLLVALLGSLVLGTLLVWRRNFALVALLHVLFNWKALGW
jgi:hypothetical protein